LVQAATLLAAISSLVLPSIIVAIQFIVNPIMSLAPGRISDARSIATLENRDYIWDHTISYWLDWVNDLPHILFGYGVTGQYRSGASLSYSDELSGLIRHPEFAFVHNSFLQQLFDGGLAGWLLLMLAAYWAGTRFSRHRRDWGAAAIVAMTVLLLGAMTEASMAPGVAEENFWLLLALVGIACQASGAQAVDSTSQPHNAATSRESKGGTDLVSNQSETVHMDRSFGDRTTSRISSVKPQS
jgi:O-antigen ligase